LCSLKPYCGGIERAGRDTGVGDLSNIGEEGVGLFHRNSEI
jgi:hypothetical protein